MCRLKWIDHWKQLEYIVDLATDKTPVELENKPNNVI